MYKKKSVKNGKKTGKDEKTGQFVSGNNYGGRHKGEKNFKTVWLEFVQKIADAKKINPEDINNELLTVGLEKAKEGDYSFWKDIHDRIYGKPVQPTDLNANVNISLTEALTKIENGVTKSSDSDEE